MGTKRLALFALMCTVIVPAGVYAQTGASIAGTVKDTSGQIMPGVTVEASSPALIEKTRVAVTDGTGQYKIVSLVPGTYTVTFTLPGFSTFKREGIELGGAFVASVNAELKVGTVSETITVTGETPIVDVQSANIQRIVTKEVGGTHAKYDDRAINFMTQRCSTNAHLTPSTVPSSVQAARTTR